MINRDHTQSQIRIIMLSRDINNNQTVFKSHNSTNSQGENNNALNSAFGRNSITTQGLNDFKKDYNIQWNSLKFGINGSKFHQLGQNTKANFANGDNSKSNQQVFDSQMFNQTHYNDNHAVQYNPHSSYDQNYFNSKINTHLADGSSSNQNISGLQDATQFQHTHASPNSNEFMVGSDTQLNTDTHTGRGNTQQGMNGPQQTDQTQHVHHSTLAKSLFNSQNLMSNFDQSNHNGNSTQGIRGNQTVDHYQDVEASLYSNNQHTGKNLMENLFNRNANPSNTNQGINANQNNNQNNSNSNSAIHK